jgi:hypothetical protein
MRRLHARARKTRREPPPVCDERRREGLRALAVVAGVVLRLATCQQRAQL